MDVANIFFNLGLLANCLLYCVRSETTLLWTNPNQPTYRILVLDAMNSPYAQSTLAHIGEKKKIPCTKLAMVYTKQPDDASQLDGAPLAKTKNPVGQKIMQRKLSSNLLHEKRLLKALDMVAVIPIP